MARPKKDPQLLMGAVIRIPVTESQKELLEKAAATTARGELASWARGVLLQAAETAVQSKKTKRKAGVSSPSAQADPSGGL